MYIYDYICIYIYTWIFKRLEYVDPFGCSPIMVEVAYFFGDRHQKLKRPKTMEIGKTCMF